ncbi:MAG: flavodoxin family protein [Elusimicrobiota bacterium]
MKVLGISAAATPNSRSELLLNSLLDEFSKNTLDVKKIFIRDLKISFCDGFRGCEKTGKCKFTDDMQVLEKAILSSDIVAVSAPIYFTSLPAKLKAVVDRCQLYWARKNILGTFSPSPKKGFFISVAGRNPDFSHAETIIRAFFSVFNIKFCGNFYLPDTDKLNDEQFAKAKDDVKKLSREIGAEVTDESNC